MTTMTLIETPASIEYNHAAKWAREYERQLRQLRREIKRLTKRNANPYHSGHYDADLRRMRGELPAYTARRDEWKARAKAARAALAA